jgi:hypothetical protein
LAQEIGLWRQIWQWAALAVMATTATMVMAMVTAVATAMVMAMVTALVTAMVRMAMEMSMARATLLDILYLATRETLH